MKCINGVFLVVLSMYAQAVFAEKVSLKTSVKATITTSPGLKNSTNLGSSMAMSADDPFVIEHLRRFKESQTKNKNTKKINALKTSSIRPKKSNIKADKPLTSKTIKLPLPNKITNKVNKTGRFVFRDITRHDKKISATELN